MGAALAWGIVATSPLVVGALLALARAWPERLIGLVLAFGAGALISAVSFELAEEGIRSGGLTAVAAGIAVGAISFYLADGLLARRPSDDRRGPSDDDGRSLALGALLDGIPEQLVLGVGLAGGSGVGGGLLAAIVVSNLPESVGGSAQMRTAGMDGRSIVTLWLVIAAICTAACVAGYLLAEAVSGAAGAAINGFAAGALLVMLVDSMIPDATAAAGRQAGLVTAAGFALATALSTI